MLELGKAGALAVGSGVRPVLADGAVVATLQASNWKEQATAVVGERAWSFGKGTGELWGRTWVADLEGTVVQVETLSYGRSTRRFVSGGQQVAHSGSTGGWSPRPTLTAAPGMPLHHQVFLLWLELLISRRASGDGFAGTFGDGGSDGGGGGGD